MQVLQFRADAGQLRVALQGFNPTGNVGAGGTGRGGAIVNLNGGTLTVTDSLLALNEAVGGAGTAGNGGAGLGGLAVGAAALLAARRR